MKKRKDLLFQQEVKRAARIVFKEDKQLFFLTWGALFFNLIVWISLTWLVRIVGKTMLIMEYNSFLGINRMLDLRETIAWKEIYAMPLVATGFLLFNWLLAVFLIYQTLNSPEREEAVVRINWLAAQLVLMGGLMVQLATAIFILALWKVNS